MPDLSLITNKISRRTSLLVAIGASEQSDTRTRQATPPIAPGLHVVRDVTAPTVVPLRPRQGCGTTAGVLASFRDESGVGATDPDAA